MLPTVMSSWERQKRRREPGTSVKCSLCDTQFFLTHEELRQMVENGEPPVCRRKHPDKPDKPDKPKRRTNMERLLVTLNNMPSRAFGPPYLIGTVVVKVWEDDPARFGLAGYQDEYPDSNKIVVLLVQAVKAGWVCRPKPNFYALTPTGAAYARRLTNEHRAADGGGAGQDDALLPPVEVHAERA